MDVVPEAYKSGASAAPNPEDVSFPIDKNELEYLEDPLLLLSMTSVAPVASLSDKVGLQNISSRASDLLCSWPSHGTWSMGRQNFRRTTLGRLCLRPSHLKR